MSSGINYKSEFDWDTNTSGVTIIKYKGKDRNVVVPRENDGKSVTSIGKKAFKKEFFMCDDLMSITLPAGLTSIGEEAFFDCSGLTSITLPDGLTSIGRSAFEGCSGLTSITLPDSVTSIGICAFMKHTRTTAAAGAQRPRWQPG